MPRPLQLADAARILGTGDSKVLAWLDGLLGVGLAVAAPFTKGLTIGLFDPKNDLIKWLRQARSSAIEKLLGADRRTRGEVMTAAGVVLLYAAYFDTLTKTSWLRDRHRGWEIRDQFLLLAGQSQGTNENDLVTQLLTYPAPTRAPGQRYGEFDAEVLNFFARPSRELLEWLSQCPAWDSMSDSDKTALERFVAMSLPEAALARYKGYELQTAGESPEFMCWLLLDRHEATQGAIADVFRSIEEAKTGLSGLVDILPALSDPQDQKQRWTELFASYSPALHQPVMKPGTHGAPAGLALPLLGDAYVNHAFRAIRFDPEIDVPHDDTWWSTIALNEGIQEFFLSCLTDPSATSGPILLLGHPGAGKSVFVRIFAARLSEARHPVVLVNLRRVPADAPIHRQISEALALTLNRNVDWADIADASVDAAPVILLDGLDELIQSSRASRSDYLEQVAEFQQAEAGRGRPVIAVVTSRTVVAHQARIPVGTPVIRLEPFNQDRITRWVAMWNRTNVQFFAKNALQPLSQAVVLRYPHLAGQPLLLLLLALYDADRNLLQQQAELLDDADLYERLLTSFAGREISKQHAGATTDEVEALVERELWQLSIAAYAMFNRDSQWVSEADLDSDLVAISDGATSQYGVPARRALNEAQLLAGRFYFIHASESTYRTAGDAPLRAYEFLHATFGEYLVARLAVRAARLVQESVTRKPSILTMVAPRPDDYLLSALLSYQVLAKRGSIIHFLKHLFETLDDGIRTSLGGVLRQLLKFCLEEYDVGTYSGYRPRDLDLVTRLAIRSANIVILLLSLHGGRQEVPALFPDEDDAPDKWRRLATLWHATLDQSSWLVLANEVQLRPWHSQEQAVLTQVTAGGGWLLDIDSSDRDNLILGEVAAKGTAAATLHFRVMAPDVLRPYRSEYPPSPAAALINLVVNGPGGRRCTGAHTIIEDASYDELLGNCLLAAASLQSDERAPFLYLIFRHLQSAPSPIDPRQLLYAAELLLETPDDDARREAATMFLIGLAGHCRQHLVPSRTVREIATQLDKLVVVFDDRLSNFDFVLAGAELGVRGFHDRLLSITSSAAATWFTVKGDLSRIARLLAHVRRSRDEVLATDAFRLADMLPPSRLARLDARDLLFAAALVNPTDPGLARKVTGSWSGGGRESNPPGPDTGPHRC